MTRTTNTGVMLEDKRKRYGITCPHCGKALYACKSVLHELGVADGGRGNCPGCGGIIRLIFNEETQSMRAEKWEKGGKP